MTRENRMILTLDEIRGVRWTCAKCGTATLFTFEKPVRLPHECPGCGAVFRDRGLQPRDDAYEVFVDALGDAHRLALAVKAMQAKLSGNLALEIDSRED